MRIIFLKKRKKLLSDLAAKTAETQKLDMQINHASQY